MEKNEDCLIISYDISENKDHTSLIVARRIGKTNGMLMVNEFFNEEAKEIYKKLIGNNL